MGTDVEWMPVRHPFFKAMVRPKGTEMPDGQLVTEDFALVVLADECVVIEGSAARLVRVLDKLKAELVKAVAEQPVELQFVEPAEPPRTL